MDYQKKKKKRHLNEIEGTCIWTPLMLGVIQRKTKAIYIGKILNTLESIVK